MEMRVDLAIVSGDATKVQEQHRQRGKE